MGGRDSLKKGGKGKKKSVGFLAVRRGEKKFWISLSGETSLAQRGRGKEKRGKGEVWCLLVTCGMEGKRKKRRKFTRPFCSYLGNLGSPNFERKGKKKQSVAKK